MANEFREFMSRYLSVDDEVWRFVESTFKNRAVKKGELITTMGDIHDRIYFIKSGLARAYTIDSDGKDFTWSIFFNDENSHVVNLFIVDYESFTNATPSRLEIEALTDINTIYVEKADLEYVNANSIDMLNFCKMMSDEAYCYLHHRVLDQQSKSAQERFEDFVREMPHLLDKVPQYHIASYLGITPIHLSRLKKEMDL